MRGLKLAPFNPKTCAVGAENRAMIIGIKEEVTAIRADFNNGIKELKAGQTDLFNHQSSRIPKETMDQLLAQQNTIKWFQTIAGVILGGVLGAAIQKALF